MLKKYLKIVENISGKILWNEVMAKHTSLRIGGKADLLIYPKNLFELQKILFNCQKEGVNYYIFGNGTNILVRDKGIRGVVINLNNFKRIDSQNCTICVEAGVSLNKLIKIAVNNSLEGLEALIGIPGSIGGAIFMNAGAYNKSLGDFVKSVYLINERGEVVEKNRKDISFEYRKSSIKEGEVIISAKLELQKGNKEEIIKKMKEIILEREKKIPKKCFHAGSVFKNPQGYYAGRIIESLNFKGFQIGDIKVSELHANIIVNLGKGTCKDFERVMKTIQKRVKEETGISLIPEICIIGEE